MWLTAFLDTPVARAAAAERFWLAVTATTLSPRRGVFATLVPAAGDAYLRVQAVGDGPARAHLDLHVADVAAARRAAVALGARPAGAPALRSPAGLPFCLVTWHGERVRPAPVRWPGGQRSLVDQLCLDIPGAGFDAEADFWAALTGWARRSIPGSDFDFLVRPDGMPLRLLLQRTGARAAGMHVDMACDGVQRRCAGTGNWARRTCATATAG
jgi:Glyoxalase-like domain